MIFTLAQLAAMFTAPALAAAGAAAVSIPIAIHLLSRLRRQRVTWAAMRFLEEAWKRQRRRMQLEQLLLLLVRCLLLAILGLALAGPQSTLLAMLGLSQSSRLICIVLDDSLPTQTIDPVSATGAARFDALKQTTIALIEGTRPGDRLALWTLSTPVEARITPGPVDRAAAIELVENLSPSYAKADAAGALQQLSRTLSDEDLPADRVVVAMVSDFPLGTLDPSDPAPAAAAIIAQRSRLWLTRPALPAANVQLTELASLRGLLLAEGDAPLSVPLSIKLRRFGLEMGQQLTGVRVTLASADGNASRAVERTHRWSPGQSEAVINLEAPAQDLLPAGGTLLIDAKVEDDPAINALAADDRRWATLAVRQSIRVGMIDAPASAGQPGALAPGRWLELAMSPLSGQTMQLSTIAPATVQSTTLAGMDALMVLRPDLLAEPAWRALAAAVQNGALVWVFPPASDAPATWTAMLAETFDLSWSLGIEAQTLDEPALLDAERPAPAVLSMLAADWSQLQRPVRVSRLLALNMQTAGDDSAWLTTTAGQPVLASAPIGRGQLILSTVALDHDWTDLMVKPLFVPLIHESLRGVLGQLHTRGRSAIPPVGQPLPLPADWQNITTLKQLGGSEQLEVTVGETGGLVTREPATTPGVYAGQPAEDRLLAVNIDARAGDTRAAAGAGLLAWFELQGVEPWINPADPASMLDERVAQADLGLPLLWTVLVLALIETLLARRISHGQATTQSPSWIAGWWRRLTA